VDTSRAGEKNRYNATEYIDDDIGRITGGHG
jgi:hypothetical protein